MSAGAGTGRPQMVLVPHTHWDREWYLTFEEFLELLVAMMDGLIDLLDRDPAFVHFHLDGQVAMIDDYLAVRPSREPDIRRLAGSGRISVGPWYTQMDEFLVSGESLIRNLEWGLRRGRELAGERVLKVGYLPDEFGHVGQMPQLLRRAGIERAVVWRGVPSAIDRTTFRWEGPDGTGVVAEYLAFGYGVGAMLAHRTDAESVAAELASAARLVGPMSPRKRLLVTVGSDHYGPPAHLPRLLRAANRLAGVEAEMGSLAEYLEEADPTELPVWRGELRSSARAHLLPGVYSTRVHQKRERGRVESLIERYAEPLAAVVPGFGWPNDDLDDAWRQLLWNGAHDSVCGCSVDGVARAVDRRYARARGIGERVARQALALLAEEVREPGVLRFNPSPFERDGVPGLGWAVVAAPPVAGAHPADVRIEEGGQVALGGLRLRLVDEGDVGDLYNFCPSGDGPATPPATVVRDGRDVVAAWPGLEVRLRASHRPGEPFVRLDGVIRNDRPDHRLRVHVTLPAQVATAVAGAPFELVERPLMSEGSELEAPSPTWPARWYVLAGDVAVLAEGVFEYEVVAGRELAVTLMRCVGTISRPSIPVRPWPAGPDMATPDAQMLGETTFSFGLLQPATLDDLPPAWERFALPLAEVEVAGGGALPAAGTLLEVAGPEVSSIRREGEAVVATVWNPSDRPLWCRVGTEWFTLRPRRIEAVRLGRPGRASG